MPLNRLNLRGGLVPIVAFAIGSQISNAALLLKVQTMFCLKSIVRAVIAMCCVVTGASIFAQDAKTALLTVAETSNFTQTSTSAEVESYVEHYAQAKHIEPFTFGRTNDGKDLVGAIVSRKPFKIGDRDERPRVLLLGNIHSGECSGKEALLIMLRKLAQNPDHAWLDNMVIVFAPNYNADGNDRMGLNHRPGQIGPERGMGLRENAQHLDLNRDFCKLESPEARALIRLIDQFDPDLFVDCHTTNGSKHRYGVTYDVPHNPSSPKTLRDFMRQKFMPTVTERLEKEGLSTFYYGNFNGNKTAWETYGHEPRYSTEYVGLRGRLSILCEDYSHNPYKARVLDTEIFLNACLNCLQENAKTVRGLIQDTEKDFIERAANNPASVTLSLDAKEVAFPEKFAIKSYDEQNQPKDFAVSFIGDYEPVKTAILPWAYVIPAEHSRQVDRLRMHGVKIEKANADTAAELQIYSINDIKRSSSPFQRHSMVSADATARTEKKTIAAGSYLIETAQPLGRLVFYMLEPMSNDGLVTWNFFDHDLKTQADFPVCRIANPSPISKSTATQIAPSNRIALEMIYGPSGLRAKSPPRPRWLPTGSSYVLDWDGREVKVDTATGSLARNPANDKASLRGALEKIECTPDEIGSLLASTPKPSADEKQLLLAAGKNIVAYAIESKQATRIGQLASDADLFEAGPQPGQAGIVAGNNLFCADGKRELWQVTDNGDDNHLNGKLDWVYQEELFGRGTFAAFWFNSPGTHVAFLQFDETEVPRYTISDHRSFESKNELSPYPNAGDPLPKVNLAIADLAQRSIRQVSLERYGSIPLLISSVGWDKTGSRVIFSVQDRGQTWIDVCAADPATGALQRLLHDESTAWVRTPGQPLFLNDGGFFWLSTRGGFSHIHQYHPDGTYVGPLTEGDWQVSQMHGLSTDERFLYFSSLKDTPLRSQLYRLEITTRELICLTDPDSDHSIDFNPNKEYFFDSASNVGVPAVTNLRSADGNLVRSIWNDPNDAVAYLETRAPEFVEVPTRDGGTMDALLILPPSFDKAKKYPVICHVYAGPQSPTVRDQYRGATYLWHQLMAQRGFVIWICDNRSASRRGLDAAWKTHGNLGANELADIEDGLDWLGQKPWIDSSRFGIWGWSYGGFMTSYALTHSTRFKAGFAGAPVTDWRNYDAIYTERLMKLPAENAAGYDASSVLKAAANLHGALLLVHGTIDDNVHMSNTLQLAAALQAADKQFQLMVYPGNRHGVQDPAQELHLWRMVTEFFEKNL